jgi:signal transduction histidine kinase
MTMINFLKNILPVSIFVVGKVIETLGNILVSISAIIYNVTATLHVQLNTETGKKLKEIEKSVADVMKMYAQAASKVSASNKESNRLANLIKNDPNVVQLGKKKNDDTKG